MRDKILTYLLEHQVVKPIEMAREFSVERRAINQCLTYELSPQRLAEQISPQIGWRLTPAGIRKAEELKKPNLLPLITNINQALLNEINECKLPHNIERYEVSSITPLPYVPDDHKYIYTAELDIPEDIVPHFREGLNVVFRRNQNSCFDAEVVEYNSEESCLYFTTDYQINVSRHYKIIVDRSFIIEGLQKRIINFAQTNIDPDLPLYKFLIKDTQNLSPVSHNAIPASVSRELDDSQKKAFDAALDNDITLIWGPPGTGKSFTLATLIRALYELEDERTVVCCVSNAAVDQLVNKVVDIIERDKLHIQHGSIYRSGRSSDERILNTEFLFPDDEKTQALRQQIKTRTNAIKNALSMGEKTRAIRFKTDIRDLKTQLKDHIEYLKAKSRIVFSTIANFTLHNQCEYDNLIVDEASMLSFPQLMALASKISKRIILVGDFQQLSPIALTDNKLLNHSIFKYCGIDIDHINHPALHLLLNQRRSNQQIVALYNSTFYKDKLVPTVTPNTVIIDNSPEASKIVAYIPVEQSVVHFTRGGTRQNDTSAECIIQLLDQLRDSNIPKTSIGIITPYVGQSNKLFAMIKERRYPEDFSKQITVGTVHTFQGAECDIIIFDIVDSNKTEKQRIAHIGKIYEGADGEQLLNVALSRARQKLYIVGDIEWFIRNAGEEISSRTITILNNIRAIQQLPINSPLQPHSREHKKWNKQEEEKLVRLFDEHIAYSQIATDLGRTEKAIMGRLQILGYIRYDKETQSYCRI